MRAMCSITGAPILIRRSRIVANSAVARGLVCGIAARTPRPLRNWGAKWLVQAILEARDRRLRARKCDEMRARLHGAAQGHVEPDLCVEPIRALLDKGCDLEADVLPTVAPNRAPTASSAVWNAPTAVPHPIIQSNIPWPPLSLM